jgi:hypothetical protein
MPHPGGYYTATKSTGRGKYYRKVKQKGDLVKKAFKLAVDARDEDHGPVKFTTDFAAGDSDTKL